MTSLATSEGEGFGESQLAMAEAAMEATSATDQLQLSRATLTADTNDLALSEDDLRKDC